MMLAVSLDMFLKGIVLILVSSALSTTRAIVIKKLNAS